MQNSSREKRRALASLIPFAVLVLLFELVPVIMVLVLSFKPEGGSGLTFENYLRIFSKKLYRSSIANSVIISLFSSSIGIIIGFTGAKAIYYASGNFRRLFMDILHMCSNFAGVPLAFSYIIMFGNVGVFIMLGKKYGISWLSDFSLYSTGGLALVYVYFQIPLATLLLVPAFNSLKQGWRESVNLLGGSNGLFWMRVGLPVLLPQLLSTFSVLFANAIAAYATAYALLTNNFPLLPIRISEQFVGDLVQRKEFGSSLAVILMLLMTVSTLIQNRIVRQASGGSHAE
jgi:putative spermidine/putrescine transport system permease protein